MMMPVPQKAPFSGLLPFAVSRYSFIAVAKSAAGRRNPCLTMATPDAPCVFFCVRALMHPFNTQWPFRHCGYRVMVAQAGQPSGWPVSSAERDLFRESLPADEVVNRGAGQPAQMHHFGQADKALVNGVRDRHQRRSRGRRRGRKSGVHRATS